MARSTLRATRPTISANRNPARFVHMTSTSGLIGGMGQANYGAAKLGMVALSKPIAVDMQRFNVRSNCIAPVAWTRMTASIPAKDPATAARIEQRKQVTPDHNAPLAVFLASDAAKDVNGQVFCDAQERDFPDEPVAADARHPSRDGWTPERCAEHMYPALKSAFFNRSNAPPTCSPGIRSEATVDASASPTPVHDTLSEIHDTVS